jgi:hypothetical protein
MEMNRIFLRKAFGTLAGGAVVLVALAVAVPPAARALVATLVQVVNTPTNAIPTVQAPAAANLYYSSCTISTNDGSGCSLTPVPAGQTLFVETISMVASGPHGTVVSAGQFGASDETFLFPLQLTFPNNTGGFDNFAGTFSGRVSFPGASFPSCLGPATATLVSCFVYGYLTPAS